LPLLGAAIAALVADAALGAARARFSVGNGPWKLRLLTGTLYLLQPVARLYGRIAHGLTPWRRRGPRALRLPAPRTSTLWSEQWRSTEDRVRALAHVLRAGGSVIRSGGDWDRWDLQVRGGLLGSARLRMAIEEHGAGRQLVRVRSWPYAPGPATLSGVLFAAVTGLALISDADAVTITLGVVVVVFVLRLIYECMAATAAVRHALAQPARPEPLAPTGEAQEPAPLLEDPVEQLQPVPVGSVID
jgi:O-antigen biosynthesis protein